MTKTEPVLGLNRFQGTRQASGEIGVLKCFFLYRTVEVAMECLANGAAVAQRLGDIAFSLVAPVLHATRPCYTANRIAVQETLLLDSKTVCCTAIRAAMQQTDFPRSNSVFIVQESG